MQNFSNKTLNSNWYEDRQAIDQPYKKDPTLVTKREKEPDLNCLTSSGIPKALGCINRKPKQVTEGIICDDGFRELSTTNRTELMNPVVHRPKERPQMNMINKHNIAELSLVDRPVGGPQTGFGSTINRFSENQFQRNFNTTNQDYFGASKKPDCDAAVAQFTETYNSQAGGNHRAFENQGVHLISNLCGEVYSKSFDPQEQTDVQRTWLYAVDPGVKAVNEGKGGKSQMLPFDNANSLPLGDGNWANQKKSDLPGAYRKVRTDVTMRPNAVPLK